MPSNEKKFDIIIRWVNEQIAHGELSAGDKLPSENELAERFEVSRQTVRHALDILSWSGKVRSVKGSGTYITSSPVSRPRANRYFNIAVVSSYLDSYVFPSVLRGIEDILAASGYTMQIAITGNSVAREKEILENIIRNDRIDALVIEPSKAALPCGHIDLYREIKARVPILFFNCARPSLDIPLVAMDDTLIGYRAATYLIERGHRDIGGILKCDDIQGHLRFAGFCKGMVDNGLRIDERRLVWVDTAGMRKPTDWFDFLVRRTTGCSALFIYNDELAYSLMPLYSEIGVDIPGDLSIVGVDCYGEKVYGPSEITSFPYPLEELGRKVADNILKLIDDPGFDAGYLFKPDIVEKTSVQGV